MSIIIWSEYLQYRAELRGFKLSIIEDILKYSGEQYSDTETGRFIAVGRHGPHLVIIPYEYLEDRIVPLTIHATTRQQIRFRLKNGRYIICE